MAPHWKCGSGQPVAGSNPALSATFADLTALAALAPALLAHAPWGALAPVLGRRLARTRHIGERSGRMTSHD